MKRKFWLVFTLLMGLVFGSCTSPQNPPQEINNENLKEKNLKVAVVVSGEIGDKGFFDSANEGLKLIQSELGLSTLYLQGRQQPDRYLDLLTSAAEEAQLVFVVPGYFFEEQLPEVVKKFPNTSFVYVDGFTNIEGMYSIRYMEHEGSFLVGALAAMLTTRTDVLDKADKEKVIGQMGGFDIPVIHNFMTGFEQGVKFIDPDVKIITRFAGTHFDPAKGRETSLAMYDEGADIIFQIAGPTGLGVFEAAKEANKYVIGVDADQKPIAPENTLASMRKKVGTSILDFTKRYLAGELKPNTEYQYGLIKDGVGVDYGDIPPDLVPEEIKKRVEELRQKIIKGEITVNPYIQP